MIRKMRILMTRILAVLLFFISLFSTSAWEDQAPLMSSTFFLIGVIFVAIASLGRMWCLLYVGGYKTERLITLGPYSMCRNPLYFFSLIGAIGLGLAFESITISAIISVAFGLYYPFVIKGEENSLKQRHGRAFVAYVNTTPMFFPRIPLLKEPQEYTVNPIEFRKGLFDALWFVWFVGILEIIEEGHKQGLIPVLFKLY